MLWASCPASTYGRPAAKWWSRHASDAKYVWDILPEQLARALADIDIPYEGEIQPFAEAPDWLLEEIANLAK